jgi:sterol desaturase/sphingolipid hydroxylase (fatty acid hydroxylase superfamily)
MIEQGPPLLMFVKAFLSQAAGYFFIVSVIFVVVWKLGAKWFSGARIQASSRLNGTQLRREVLNSLITLAIGTVNAVVISSLYVSGKTKLTLEAWGVLPSLATLLALLLMNDGWFYFWHRLMHHPKLFKHVHAVHHRSIDVNPYSSYSFHALEAFILGAWVIPFLVFVPMSIPLLGGLQVIGLANNIMSHLGYEFFPRWLLRIPVLKFINTSTFHNQHHTAFNGNYGLMFRFWDVLFGTQVKGYEALFLQRGAAQKSGAPPQVA